jgi:hypothetical protein
LTPSVQSPSGGVIIAKNPLDKLVEELRERLEMPILKTIKTGKTTAVTMNNGQDPICVCVLCGKSAGLLSSSNAMTVRPSKGGSVSIILHEISFTTCSSSSNKTLLSESIANFQKHVLNVWSHHISMIAPVIVSSTHKWSASVIPSERTVGKALVELNFHDHRFVFVQRQ